MEIQRPNIKHDEMKRYLPFPYGFPGKQSIYLSAAFFQRIYFQFLKLPDTKSQTVIFFWQFLRKNRYTLQSFVKSRLDGARPLGMRSPAGLSQLFQWGRARFNLAHPFCPASDKNNILTIFAILALFSTAMATNSDSKIHNFSFFKDQFLLLDIVWLSEKDGFSNEYSNHLRNM